MDSLEGKRSSSISSVAETMLVDAIRFALEADNPDDLDEPLRKMEEAARAGELGNPKSCRTLACMYHQGQGVLRDLSLAEQWMAKADALAAEEQRKNDHPMDPERAKEWGLGIVRKWLETILGRRDHRSAG